MDANTLARAMGCDLGRAVEVVDLMNAAMLEGDITNVHRAAMWCAQLGHESEGLETFEEYASGAAYQGRADLGNTRPGDGVRFKGRGPIQVTGRYNYTNLSRWAHGRGLVSTPTFFVDNPPALATDRYGFLGAVWYWTTQRPLNAYSDADDVRAATKAINGGYTNLDDRLARWNRCRALGAAILPTDGGLMANATPGQVTEIVTKSGQLGQAPGTVRKVSKTLAKFLPPSFRVHDAKGKDTGEPATNPWSNDMWAALVNEVVWDGYDLTTPIEVDGKAYAPADVPLTAKLNLVSIVRVMAARQARANGYKADGTLEA